MYTKNNIGDDNMRNGLITTALGTAVTAGSVALRASDLKNRRMHKNDVVPMIETAALGFGLAHIVLGTVDLLQNRR